MTKSDLEIIFMTDLRVMGIYDFECEYRFAAIHVGLGKGIRERLAIAGLQDWRFDYAWPEKMLAVELEGGTWVNGAHNRGAGYEDDCRKYNAALRLGWRVLRFTAGMVKSGEALNETEKELEVKE